MPHIDLPQLPGIVGLLVRYPQTAGPLNGLAEALLRGPSSLSAADRETIAAYVSARNECTFCAETHGAVARHLHATHEQPAGRPPDDAQTRGGSDSSARAGGRPTAGAGRVDDVIVNGERADVGPKLQALLAIAGKVRIDGRSVTAADVARAREAGADDKAIHDTVLIAAAFCMYNRYVDGLATVALDQPADYVEHAKPLAEGGYLQGPPPRR